MEKKFENPVFVTSLPKYDHSTAVIHLLKLILITGRIDFCDINMPVYRLCISYNIYICYYK